MRAHIARTDDADNTDFTSRIKYAMNGDFETTKGSAALYAWFVWEMGWKAETRVRWI